MRKNGMPGLPRRLRHGGGGGGRRDFELLRRIESMGLTHDHPDVVAEKLRAECKDYARIKLQPFAAQVHRVLQRHQQQQQQLQLRNQKNWQDQRNNRHRGFWNGLGDGAEHQNQKSLRPLYTSVASTKSERRDSPGEAGPPSSSPSHSGSSSSYSSEEKDAIFDAKVDPEVDLTKSMLRQRYSSKPKSTAKAASMEIENATDKPKRKLLETGDGSGVEETLVAAGEGIAQGGAGEKDGPMFSDFGGIRLVLDELITEVLFPLCHPELPRVLGVRPMAGILLHGPPGCGKTRLAHAIANEAGVPFYKICATDIVSGISGESEGNVRDLFKKAYRTAPSIVFIDEIDAIASKRENMQKEMEKRIVTQLMTCMDESHQMLRGPDTDSDSETSAKKTSYVLVIGATNRPDAVEPALRRPGRFDKEIVLGVPDEYARKEILSVLTKKLRLDGTFDLFKIARSTPGYVGADLTALVNKAGNLAMKRIIDIRKTLLPGVDNEDDAGGKAWWKKPWTPDEVDSLSIKMDDFEEAVKLVQPSLRREGFSPVPDVRWDDVGGLHSLREEFERYVVRHIKNPDVFEEFGVTSETGFLLYGPPGCGKTLIAKAVAHEAGANFIHVKGPELLNKYVGESELAVRTLFSRARTCAPCILFFDEVDAITTKRGKEGGWVVERLLNQLLIELDGADKRHGVHVIGATNRPEVIDPAVKRPGRLGREMYVPLPTAEERGLILKASARKKPLAADVDLDTIGRSEACENFSGADLNEVVNKAATLALEDWLSNWSNSTTEMRVIKTCHFEQALKEVFPSVSEKDMKYYNDYRRKKGLRESPPSSLMKLSLMK